MNKFNTLISIAGLGLVVAACGGEGGVLSKKRSNAPGSNLSGAEKGNRENPSEEATKAFARAAAAYSKAAGGGALAKSDCGRVAGGFSKVYEKYGDQMIIAKFNAAAAFEECGDGAKAKGIYEELAKAKYWPAYNNLGVIHWKKGNTSKALDYFKKAVAADRTKAFAARNNLAVAHRDQYSESPKSKDFKEAEKQLRNVLVVDTSNKKAYENLARLYFDKGRLEEKSYLVLSGLVVDQALRVLKDSGDQSAELWNLRGLLFLERDNNQIEALKMFLKAVEIESRHTDANLNIAFISIRFRDYTQAEKSFAIALTDPAQKRNVEAYLAMGVAKRGLKKFKDAKKYYNKAAKVDGKDPRPHFNLGILNQEHLIGQDNVGTKEIEAFYNTAKKHYNKYASVAGSSSSHADGVEDAKDRVVVIDDAIRTFRVMEDLERQAKAMEVKAKAEEAKERKRMLDLEAKAMAAMEEEETPTPASTKSPKGVPGKDDASRSKKKSGKKKK